MRHVKDDDLDRLEPLLRQLRLATIKHERRTMTQPYSVRLSALFPVSTS